MAARLPNPGSDDGTWGTILNDYLSQVHAADGTLKPSVVQASSLNTSTGSDGNVLTKDSTTAGGFKWGPSGGGATASYPNNSGTATVVSRPRYVNVRDYGALGNSSADDTTAVANAMTAAHNTGDALYFPKGTYRLTSFPALASNDVIIGDGPGLSTIVYEGNNTFIAMSNLQKVQFSNLNFWITGTSGKGFQLSGCFRCSFESVVIRGNSTGSNYTTYANSVGVRLDSNSGSNTFNDSEINNFGTGLATYCIQNYLSNCRLLTNHITILGSGNNTNAGISVTNTDIVGDGAAGSRFIYVDGASNAFWFSNTWMETAEKGVVIGTAAGGPAQFGMVNCKIASQVTCMDIQYCRQPYLENISFDPDPNSTPTPLVINASTAAEGAALNLITTISGYSTVPENAFPQYWNVMGRGWAMSTTFNRTVGVRNINNSTNDFINAMDQSYQTKMAVVSSGAVLINGATAGLILRAPNGTYYRVTVSNTGTLSATSIGTGRPNA